MVFSLIVVLLFVCRPSTIGGFIVSVVVDAVNAMLWRGFSSHIGKKIGVNQPAFTHRNASPSIILPTFVVGISTSFPHRNPSAIFQRSTGLTAFAMFIIEMGRQFFMQASARFGVARAHGIAFDLEFCSTFANASPRAISSVSKDKQSSETLTRDIDEFGHCLLPSRAVVSCGYRAL